MNPISKMIWPQCAVHNAKHTRIFLHRGIFFSFSLVLSLLHTTTTGYVQRQDKVSHWLPQWEIFEVKYWCFFYQILMKRNERTLYRIELLYMMQNNFSQVGQYVSKFWNCQFLQRRCSDQYLILGFQISQSKLNLLNYYSTHCACPWNSCV